MRARGGALRTWFAALAILIVAVGAAGAIAVEQQTRDDAKRAAERRAHAIAAVAAAQLADLVATVRASVAAVAASPGAAEALRKPAGCTLSFDLGGAAPGHLDLVRADGTVVCSSYPLPHGRFAGYRGEPWLRHPPSLAAPVTDALTREPSLRVAVPLRGGTGLAAATVALTALAGHLVRLYAGGDPVVLLVADRNWRVLARSRDPRRWIGRSILGTPLARPRLGAVRGPDGRDRLYALATVPGAGWRVLVGEDEAAVLADARSSERRQLEILLPGLLLVLAGLAFVYRRVARPIQRLAVAVREAAADGAPHPLALGGPAEVRGLVEDINGLTEAVARELAGRKRAEAEARRAARSYQELFQRHPAPMWLFDPATLRFLEVNDAALQQYGYTREEFLAMTLDQIRPAEDREAFAAKLREGLPEAAENELWRHVRKDGGVIDVAVSARALTFEGRPARLVLARDVSEQRRLEEQLRQAERMEAVGRLTGGIAHDFNNLLLVIRGHSALLLKRLGDEKLRGNVQQIADAAERAGELTQQLLAFSRQQVLQPEVTSLNEVVAETLRLLEPTLGAGVEVETELDPALAHIFVDRGQLTRAVLDLALNAREAMPEGGTLSIRTATVELDDAYAADHPDVAPGTYALLQVTDSGRGMDAEARRRAFDPFSSSEPEGAGLRLASVYGLVRQSGGHVWLYSEPGLGTTFKLYFPVADATPSEPRPAAAPGRLGGDETILVVEDTDSVRALVTTTLESYGYRVLAAASGAEAIELARRHEGEIALLMTDVVMPGMNGRELAEALLARYPHLRVLFTSGYPSDTVVRHGIAEASVAFIEKPYLPDELARKIRSVLA